MVMAGSVDDPTAETGVDDPTVASLDVGVCSVGIESTVAKVELVSGENGEDESIKLVLFRRGGVAETDIMNALKEGGLERVVLEVVQKKRAEQQNEKKEGASSSSTAATKGEEVGEQAPGQLLTHYSPDITTFLLQTSEVQLQALVGHASASASASAHVVSGAIHTDTDGTGKSGRGKAAMVATLRQCVVVDFGGSLKSLQAHVLAYKDLSPA
jgi:hypothetical protein